MNERQLNACIRELRYATYDGDLWMPDTLYIVDERVAIDANDWEFLLVVEKPEDPDEVLATVKTEG